MIICAMRENICRGTLIGVVYDTRTYSTAPHYVTAALIPGSREDPNSRAMAEPLRSLRGGLSRKHVVDDTAGAAGAKKAGCSNCTTAR